MRDRWIGGVGRVVLGAMLLIALPILGEAPLFADLSAVQGIAHYRGPDAGKDLLAKNGFVVTQEFQRHIFLPYLNDALPHFVTADSVHRTFHVLLEDHLKLVESNAAGEAALMLSALRGSLESQPPDVIASGALAPLAAEARTLALAFLQVAEVLLSSESVPPDLPAGVAAEVAAILNAGGFGASPLFREGVDYSQYKPRGFYTESPELQRYFRAMSWFGNSAFLLGSDVQTLAALMLSKALQDTPEAQQRWRKLDNLYTRFLGPCDDLTPEEYGAQLPGIGVLDSPAALEGAIARMRAELRNPKINSMLTAAEKSEWVAQTKGMRFMGKRYLPDSEIFLALVEPEVSGRTFPSGLDLMAANGSTRAAELIAGTPEGSQPDYIAAAAKSREIVSEYKRDSDTHYAAILRLAETLTAPPVAQAAPFVRTAAYSDKNLMTSLAAWASTRHTWALHAKQPMAGGGRPDPEETPPGYVEPNPAFFSAIKDLVDQTTTLFRDVGLTELRRLEEFGFLVEKLAEIVRKELASESMTEDECYLLADFGFTLKRLHGMEGGVPGNSSPSWMSLVMDVYTDTNSEKCLEVATGGAMPIYVILEHGGKPHLLIGSVYSYYEFLQPISERLTDEKWRGQWDEGRVPELPAWSGSFVAGKYDIETVIQRLRDGEEVTGLEFIHDPALDAYLIENVGPDSPLLKRDNVAYLFNRASRCAPEIVNPILLNMLRDGDLAPVDVGSQRGYGAVIGALAIASTLREKDLPKLLEIMSTSDVARAEVVMDATVGLQRERREAFLVEAVERCSDPVVKAWLLHFARFNSSVGIAPALLKRAHTEHGPMEIKCLITLADICMAPSRRHAGFMGVSSTAHDEDLVRWKDELNAAIIAALAEFDWASYIHERDLRRREAKACQQQSIWYNTKHGFPSVGLTAKHQWARFQSEILKEIATTTGSLHLEGAVPFLGEALHHADRETSASILEALANIGTDEAADILAKSTDSRHLDPVLKSTFRAYMYDRDVPDSKVRGNALILLLENTSAFGGTGLRVCDIVLGILANVDIPDHPGLPLTASLADRDAKVAEWIAYLQERPLPSDFEDDVHGFDRLSAPGSLSAPGRPRMRSAEE